MKLKQTVLTLTAILGVTIATALAGDPTAKTKTEKTTAKSKAKTEETIPGADVQPAAYFYTGKPYDEDLGGYVFNYRTYSATISRWTTTDVSGFPDGSNNSRYAPTPTSRLDKWGLFTLDNYAGNPPEVAFGYHHVKLDTLTHITSATFPDTWTFTGWNFVPGLNIEGTMEIMNYEAQANSTSGRGLLGLRFTGGTVSTAWVQRWSSNAFGDVENYESFSDFDKSANGAMPIYPSGRLTGHAGVNPTFIDNPLRGWDFVNSARPTVAWRASLYLVSVTDLTNTITVHDGVSWGFTMWNDNVE